MASSPERANPRFSCPAPFPTTMQPTIWTSLARYCSELAPVVGPLLAATSELAQAVDRAALPSASTRNLITTELDSE
jgi:hypothetical protein